MSTVEPLSHLIGIKINNGILTKEESFLLEAEVFVRVCEELIEIFREKHKEYFHLMKFNIEKENNMLEDKFAQLLINDILSTDEYNTKGIAYYTNTYEDVILEIMAGRNNNPSSTFLRRLIDLHRSVRKDLYNNIIKKIVTEYLSESNKTSTQQTDIS